MTQDEPDDNAFDFSNNPIPADFFGPGSDPFAGLVPVKADPGLEVNPLDQDDVPGQCAGAFTFGDADTLVARDQDPFSRCDIPPEGFPSDPRVVEIEIVSLNLVSCGPITVHFPGEDQQWDVSVSVNTDNPLNTGSLRAIKEHCNGGTFTSELSVCPIFTFVRVDNPQQVHVIDFCEDFGLPILLNLEPQGWVHDPAANVCINNPVCTDFHPGVDQAPDFDCTDCQPNGIRDACDIEDNTSQDCQPNGVPDECDVPQSVGCPIGTCTEDCSEDCNENCVPDECEPDIDGDGVIDDCDPDADGDGFEGPLGDGSDCDDSDPDVNPGEEESAAQGNCNDGKDNDCDGNTDAADPDCP